MATPLYCVLDAIGGSRFMAELPPLGPPSSPPEPERSTPGPRSGARLRLPLLLAALAGTAATVGVLSLDRLAAETYGRLQPGLERQLGNELGQPVELGPYRGLTWLGLRLGPSRVQSLPSHPSGVEMGGIAVNLDPLASLRRRLPVLEVNLQGVQTNLRPNEEGSYWRLPDPDPETEPPRLVARVRLPQPARVILERGTSKAELALQGSVVLEPHLARASALLRLRPLAPGQASAGALQLRAGGNWRTNQWQGQLTSRDLGLQWWADLLGVDGELDGRVDGQLQLAWRDGEPSCQGDLRVRQLSWRPQPDQQALSLERPLLRCQGRDLSLASSTWRWGERSGQLGLQARWQSGEILLQQLQLSSGRSWLWARGALTPNPDLSGDWQLEPGDLPLPEGLEADLVGSALRGSLQLAGSWSQPLLSTRVNQARNPLLGPWQAQLRWRDQRLLLDRFASEHLSGQGSLPLALAGAEGLRAGLLDLRLQLQRFPLPRLSPLLGAELHGVADAEGTIRGPLSGLTPEFFLRLEQPGAGPLLVAETWEGNWFGDPAGGGRLRMTSRGEAPPGRLEARLDRRWVPVAVSLERNDGRLRLEGSPRAYNWTATDFPLVGLQLALGPTGEWRALRGGLSGAGVLELQPLAFLGRVELDQPALLGVPVRRVVLDGSYRDRRYQATGEITTEGGGELDLEWSGIWRGDYVARLSGRNLDDGLVRRMLEAWPRWRGEPGIDPGSAADLGSLMIDTMGGSIDDLLVALNRAHARLRQALVDQRERLTPAQRLEGVAARFDLEMELSGPRLADTRIDGSVEGHLWFPGQDRDQALTGEPLRLELNGPARLGSGSFGFSGVPISLLALFTPVPDELRGRVSSTGTYTLGAEPALALELVLDDATLGDTELALQRGSVQLEGNAIAVDLALRADGADSGIDLAGRVPLDPTDEGIELRATSRDDGLIFLSRLAQPTLVWQEGSADLQLLVRGSLERPIANGFLRIQNGQLTLLDQEVDDLQATLLFDFEQLLLQEFSARVGGEGTLSGSGSLGLFSPQVGAEGEPARLLLALEGLPYRSPRLATDIDGELVVGGSLTALRVGGALALANGSVNVQPGRLAGEEPGSQTVASVQELAEQSWDFQEPLVLLGPELDSRNGEDLRALVPNVSFLGFDGLRISLGEDFSVVVPQLADFKTSGSLRIDGPLSPDIEARGVVKLERGRLNLFTTNFVLDRNSPNVAVFTPSLGLIPFLDITLRTRVSDTITSGGVLSGSGSTSIAATSLAEQQSGLGSLNQLNLVQVFLSVSGPADRLADNISLRSTPALPEDRLLALIGGNSLAGLGGDSAGAALATVLGQTLLSPVLGTLGEAFGERLSFAIYPTFVNQEVGRGSNQRSGRVPPALVLATEVGVDVSEQFNFSVLAAPNRTDVPPQVNLTFRASDLVNLQGSLDTEGAWQTQLQVFFRF
ncbi:translocation/assembly module TamB domain-containing protein [Cyanobium sp. ATX 6A2]|uniref:translocation/assembly module TamB domain-containing protein n=1 Tax=Cyanobium sp. ATX 6A2 TaxID=2823700 RepID=UPI0020CF562B|nr:translocation/assembly module TamB domain-containing protein [Cyanobium sp. ATX 6A2]MCP9888815.1 translocation/assembly module TamB domain-containing protein [Cyanobium sp. ATX 6A2]